MIETGELIERDGKIFVANGNYDVLSKLNNV